MGKRVAVVGAGIVGSSIAWHLAQEGCDVVVVDAAGVGGVATPNSFAWINASWGNPESYFHFRRRSMARWHELDALLPSLDVNFCGSILWDLPSAELAAYQTEHRAWGYGLRRVGPDEIGRIEPNLLNPPETAMACAEEGSVEPAAACKVFLDALLALGGEVRTMTTVESLLDTGGRITGLKTSTGERIDADEVVLATGTETTRLLQAVGVTLRMTAPAGLIAHTTISPEKLLNGLVMAPSCHVRQTREGRLIIGADFAGADPKEDPDATARGLLDDAKALVRGAETLDLAFHTIGYRPTPADEFPAIGRPSSVAGLTVAVMHSGVTLAPIVGQLVARDIAKGEHDRDLDAYDPNRVSLM